MKSFTYLIGWSALGLYYYGARYSKKCSPADLWTTYFTSSERVASMRLEHGEPDIVEVRKTFDTPEGALNWEVRVLKRLKVTKNDRWAGLSDDRKAEIREARNAGIKASWERRRLAKAERTT